VQTDLETFHSGRAQRLETKDFLILPDYEKRPGGTVREFLLDLMKMKESGPESRLMRREERCAPRGPPRILARATTRALRMKKSRTTDSPTDRLT
jgi:hypothetical protein